MAALAAPAALAVANRAGAQDPGPKPRLELSDSARRATDRASAATESRNTAPRSAPRSRAATRRPAPAPAVTGVRPDFVRNQVLLGITTYGPAFATSTGRDPLTWTAGYLLVAGGSFVAAAEVSRDIAVSDPMQRLATGFPIRGAVAGLIGAAMLDANSYSTGALVFLTSVGGTAAGLWRGRTMDDGEAAATLFGSDVLGLTGWGLGTAMGLRNEGEANQARLALTLGGMLAGAPLGQAYAAMAPYNVTAGDLAAMGAASGVGMLAGLTAIANGQRTDREVAAALTAGGLVGLVVGDRFLTRRYDHTTAEAQMMIAGGAAGGLMGAGVALLTGGSTDRWSAYSGAFATAGAAAGVAWAQYYMKPKSDGVARVGGVQINPMGVVAAATGMHGAYTLGTIRF